MKDVVVIDDEPKICGALKAFFEERGFHVAITPTAHAAMELLRQVPAEVALLDLKLPDASGLDVLSSLKAQFPNLRVVVISCLADPSTMQEALDRGADEFLAKPFELSRCFDAAVGPDAVDLGVVQPEPDALARVPVSVAKQYQVLPVRWAQGELTLAMADPLDAQRLDELKALLGCAIKPFAAISGEMAEAIRRCYGIGAAVSEHPGQSLSQEASGLLAEPSAPALEGPTGIAQLVSELIQHAHANRATDLHLGLGPKGPWVQERIDGILYEVPIASQFGTLYSSVVSRIKVMANLDIAEHRLPQDGRIYFEADSTKLDLRVSILPTPHGESIAIRILEPTLIFQLNQLGLAEEQVRGLESLLVKPTGLLLATGPTGSGKSTTLYALLSRLNTGRVNIVTIEDPIEHELPRLTQIQVKPKVGLTFATGLRSILRHDPDIIMVGEIRDQDTASLAVRAAMTGHLVLSTLHTNDASSGITRLLDLGVEPFLLCSTVSGIVSQRLIRVLCVRCRDSAEVDAEGLSPLGIAAPGQAGSVKVWRARGCPQCLKTGYFGRTGAFELLVVDHHIRSLIIKRASGAQIRQSAISRGMQTLWQSGWQKAQAGITSLEELIRVLPAESR